MDIETFFSSSSSLGEPQPANEACQKNVKDLKKEVKGDTSEAVFFQTGALGKSNKNGDDTSTFMNRKQNSSFLPKDKKQPLSNSKISREKENNDSPSSISHRLKKALPVAMFNDCEESSSGKITLQDFPSTVEAFKPTKDKIITEAKCGAFDVQIAIENRFFCKTAMRLPTKKRCQKCHQCYSVRHIQRCYTSRSCSSKSKETPPSKYEGEIARTESPSLKVSIIGKGIKVKYMSQKQNIIINITHPKKGKTVKYGNVSSNYAAKECPRSSAQSGGRFLEKWQLENKHPSSDCSHVSPPIVFAVPKENFDTIAVSLCSTLEEKNKPDTLSSVLGDCEVESAISQQKDFKVSQNSPQKEQFSEAETILQNIFPTSHDTLKSTSLSNTDLSKMPFEDPKDIDNERKINFDIPENITSDSYIRQSTEGINCLPSIITDIFPVQDGKDSDFYSLSSPKVECIEEKADIYCKGSKIPAAGCCENLNSISFPCSKNTLQSSTPFSPSHWTTRDSEPKETPADTFSFDHCDEFAINYEQEQVDVTDRDPNKATVHSDSRTNAQLLEMKSAQCPTLSLASSGGITAGSPLNSSSHSSLECGQTEFQASHPETAARSKTKVSVMTSITDELEQRLIIQNDKEDTVDSNCPMGMKNLKEKFLIRPVVKNTCHRDFEELSKENHDEVCLQMDFPPNTAEFNCAMCATDNLFLIEKTLTSDADQYSNQDEINLGLSSFKQEPAECQRIASRRMNSEGDKNDPMENYYHHIDLLLSPLKQKALKGTVGYTESLTLFLHI